MDAYCARVGKEAGSIRFLFDGDRIAPDSTPNDLGMEDEDEIDAMVEVFKILIFLSLFILFFFILALNKIHLTINDLINT